jgi:hypothetical protein
MLTHPTLDRLRALRLDGMAQAFVELEAQERDRFQVLLSAFRGLHNNDRRYIATADGRALLFFRNSRFPSNETW